MYVFRSGDECLSVNKDSAYDYDETSKFGTYGDSTRGHTIRIQLMSSYLHPSTFPGGHLSPNKFCSRIKKNTQMFFFLYCKQSLLPRFTWVSLIFVYFLWVYFCFVSSHWLNSPPDPYTPHCFLLCSLSSGKFTGQPRHHSRSLFIKHSRTRFSFYVYVRVFRMDLGNIFFYFFHAVLAVLLSRNIFLSLSFYSLQLTWC